VFDITEPKEMRELSVTQDELNEKLVLIISIFFTREDEIYANNTDEGLKNYSDLRR